MMSSVLQHTGRVVIALGYLSVALGTMLSGAVQAVASTDIAPSELPSVPQERALQLSQLEERPLFLDVRSEQEFRDGHIEGSLNIPFDQLAKHLQNIGRYKEREVIVYCEVGRRAVIAAQVLIEAGFRKLAFLEGDMKAWRRRSLPMAKGDALESGG
jgi:phage shock protein E